MVDRIVKEEAGYVVALKNVTINEPYFQGHFPEPREALMPGTLILEAMAQTAAFLLREGAETEGYLVGVEKARFRRRVVPGDQLILKAHSLRNRKGLMQAEVEASVNGQCVATAIISLMQKGRDDVAVSC